MANSYTQDDLILFIYNELNQDEHQKLAREIVKNDSLRNEYESLLSLTASLDELKSKPHQSSIEIILESTDSLSSLEMH